VVLWPHGVLFRDSEAEMRKKMIESDVVDCVIGLGPNLFYNSPMESCLLICSTKKPKERKNKILFINAVNEVKSEKAMSYLSEEHIQKIYSTYRDFKALPGFSEVVNTADVLTRNATLMMSVFIDKETITGDEKELSALVKEWQQQSEELRVSVKKLISDLRN
jgi:type I restriction enzyme M protein